MKKSRSLFRTLFIKRKKKIMPKPVLLAMEETNAGKILMATVKGDVQ